MTYTKKKCPHCGKTYESYSTVTKRFNNHSGCPFLKCSNCGKTFVDKDIKEPALSPFNDFEFSILGCVLALFFPWGLFAIVFTCSAIYSEPASLFEIIFAVFFNVIFIALLFYGIKNRNELKEEAKKEYEESKKRLQNSKYALALKNAGFYVPDKYLPTETEIKAEIEARAAFDKTFSKEKGDDFSPEIRRLSPDEWRCSTCGRVNQNYVGTCACGERKKQ